MKLRVSFNVNIMIESKEEMKMTEKIDEMYVKELTNQGVRTKCVYLSPFHGEDVPFVEMLKHLDEQGMRPAGLDELLRMRVKAENRPSNTTVWKESVVTGSIVASGRTKAGNGVVVIAHRDHYLSSLDNVFWELHKGIADGTAEYPRESFDGLLCREDNKDVFVLDYKDLVRCAEYLRESDERSAVGRMMLVFGLDDKLAAAVFGSYAVAEGYRSKLQEVRAELGQKSRDEKVHLYINYSLSSLPECTPLMLMSGTCSPVTDIPTFGVDSNLGSEYIVGVPKEKSKEPDKESAINPAHLV